ncbi:hypothetical protein BD310DRAFT_925066 [Dichomitus squalens]|uniref:Uncharacterized protein n=1 Tax=Dichomitus squalens TaxID=114155 RepID=A0A4V2K8C0_9APHY|nr:hypothetical protein BD310DRAFT_925066 [Dichomitus squalens]
MRDHPVIAYPADEPLLSDWKGRYVSADAVDIPRRFQQTPRKARLAYCVAGHVYLHVCIVGVWAVVVLPSESKHLGCRAIVRSLYMLWHSSKM